VGRYGGGRRQLLAQQGASLILQGRFGPLEHSIRRARLASERCDDAILLSHEPLVSAALALTRGELNPAESFFRAVNNLLDKEDLRLPAHHFGHDPMVLSLGWSAISAWMLGRPDEARKRARLGLERANAIAIPQVMANGLDAALTIEYLRRDVEQASPLASAFTACLDKFDIKYPYPHPLSACNWLRLQSGDTAAGIAVLRQDIEKTLAARMGLFLPLIYITLAEACLTAGNTGDGFAALDEACARNEAPVGDGSCKEQSACRDNAGTIEYNACVGSKACQNNVGHIMDESCIGSEACRHNTAAVGIGSCMGARACEHNEGTIGTGSCNAEEACQYNEGVIEDGDCNSITVCKFGAP